MSEEAAKISDVEELYFIKPPRKPANNGRQDGDWRRVSKQDFAQFDGPAVFGVKEEIKAKIAEIEEIPDSCVTDESGYGKPYSEFIIRCNEPEQIPVFLERVKRDGRPAEIYYNVGQLKHFIKYSGKPVYRANEYRNCNRFAIGDEWVFQGNKLRHDPAGAVEIIELSKKLPVLTKTPRTKIKIVGMLGPLWRMIDDRIDKMSYFTKDYPGRRSWNFRRLVRVNSPSTIEQYLWAIPIITKFYTQLTRKKDYRTLEWKKIIKSILPLLKDPMVTKDFRKFIVRETCNR